MKKNQRWIAFVMLAVFMLSISSAQAESTLKLNGVNTQFLGDFSQHHTDVKLNEEDYKYYATTGEIVSDLLLGAFDYDVFEMSNAFIDYRMIMEKGYCLDISSSEIIQNAIQQLHPVFAEQCVVDGKIFTMPHCMQMNYMAISSEALEQAGIKNVERPTTFPEFLDFLEMWIAYLQENPDCEVAMLCMGHWGDPSWYYPDSYTSFLVEQLLLNYMMQKEYAGETISFDDEELILLLERCYQIGQDLYLYDPAVQVSTSVLQRVESMIIDDYDFLSLRLHGEQPHLISVYVTLYAANAMTPNPELCIELMEAMCINNWPIYNTYFYKNSEPLLDPQYDNRVEQMQSMIQNTQYQLGNDNLDAAYRAELEFRLERQQANLQKLLENDEERYLVSTDELEQFCAYVDCLYVQMPGLFHANDVENAQAFQQLKKRFSTGQMSAVELVKELNRMAWMIEMEGK